MGTQGAFVWVATGTLLAAGCGIGVRRDLAETPAKVVIFDDACGVQEYHDTLMMKKVEPPEVVTTNEIERTEGKRLNGGKTTFAFEKPYQVQTMRRMLRENWSGVPDEIMKSNRIELEVRWSEKAGVRRVVTSEDAAIGTGTGREMLPLPYHVCLSELLFGGPLYKTRRDLLGLSPIATPAEVAAAAPVASPPPAPVEVAAPTAAPVPQAPAAAPTPAGPVAAPTPAVPVAVPTPGARVAAPTPSAPVAAPTPAAPVKGATSPPASKETAAPTPTAKQPAVPASAAPVKSGPVPAAATAK